MSKAQESCPATGAEPAAAVSAAAHGYGPAARPDGAPGGDIGRNDGADLGGHTSLSRPAPPQGRRSLFGR